MHFPRLRTQLNYWYENIPRASSLSPLPSLSLSISKYVSTVNSQSTLHWVHLRWSLEVADWSGQGQTVWRPAVEPPAVCHYEDLWGHLEISNSISNFHSKRISYKVIVVAAAVAVEWQSPLYKRGWSMAGSLACIGLVLSLVLSFLFLSWGNAFSYCFDLKFVEFWTEFWQLPLGCIWNSMELCLWRSS